MSFLLRKEVGNFTLLEANTLEELDGDLISSTNTRRKFLLPPDFPFRHMERIVLTGEGLRDLFHGRTIPLKELRSRDGNSVPEPVDEEIVPVYTTKGQFMGLAQWKTDQSYRFRLKPEKMIRFGQYVRGDSSQA